MKELNPGLEGTAELTVTGNVCARVVGSGSLDVLATPVLVMLFEKAACAALEGQLDEGDTSVGSRVDVEHLAPTPVGGTVKVTARLTEVKGRLLTFACEASDNAGHVGRALHVRAVIKAGRFMEKAASRVQS